MAENRVLAIEFIGRTEKYPPPRVCAVFGDDSFLRRQATVGLRSAVLGGDDGDFSLRTFPGRDAELRDVLEELSTVAMFGSGRRLVVVEEADGFVTRYRAQLEKYVASPSPGGVLVLDLDSLQRNTRLYKLIAAEGLVIDCGTPSPAALTKWLVDWAKRRHQSQLSPAAADVLVDMVGPELGLLDQELAKLALLAGEGRKIAPELVSRSVGGWRAKTTWDMLDAALDGNVREAIAQLNLLLASGEQPVGLLAQIAASLRRLANATRLILQAEEAGRRLDVRGALEQVGVKSFVLEKTAHQLRRLGRYRGDQLHRWLLQADVDLKGESQLPPRLVLERLIVRLAREEPARPRGAKR